MVDKAGDPYRVAMVPGLEAYPWLERMFAMAVAALDEAMEPLPLRPGARLPIFLGLPELTSRFTKIDVDALCRRITQYLAPRCVAHIVPIPEGNAAGIVALEHGCAMSSTPAGPTCFIVGGVDSWIDPDLLEALDDAARIISLTNRWGFPPGEGAAMLGVCTATMARQLGVAPLGTIAALATAMEPARMGSTSICTGEVLAHVMRVTAKQASGRITLQLCDIDGERYREHEFSHAILRLHPDSFVNSIDYVAPVDAWGHVGAASAPLLIALAVLRHARGFSCGSWPMIWCGSENGRRGAVVLQM